MSKTTIVIGHMNPDTDSIAASIAIANLIEMEGGEAKTYKKGNTNKETNWALNYSNLSEQIKDISEVTLEENQEVFFVDFNEENQSPLDPSKIKLIGLIDHHKLGSSWKTEEPILFRVEPIGSSSTLTAKIYQEKNVDLPLNIAKILLCGIISDTLKLTSPTTTKEDEFWAKALTEKVQGNLNELADNLFEAKSDLSSFTPEEIAKLDYKVFDFGAKRVGIGVIETVKPAQVKKIEKELKEAIRKIKTEEKLDLIYLGIVDILKNETELLLVSNEEKMLTMKSFSDIVISGDNLILKGIVSRKKQIAPALERVLKEMGN